MLAADADDEAPDAGVFFLEAGNVRMAERIERLDATGRDFHRDVGLLEAHLRRRAVDDDVAFRCAQEGGEFRFRGAAGSAVDVEAGGERMPFLGRKTVATETGGSKFEDALVEAAIGEVAGEVGEAFDPRAEPLELEQQAVVAERVEFLAGEDAGVKAEFEGAGNHRAGDDLGVVVIDPFGEGVTHLQQVEEFGKSVAADGAVLVQLDDEMIAGEPEEHEEALVVTKREAAEEGVAMEVVEEVGADATGNDFANERRNAGAFEERCANAFGLASAGKDGVDRGMAKKMLEPGRVFVVAVEESALVLESVAERDVSDVVKQRREEDGAAVVGRDFVAGESEGFENPAGEPAGAEAVFETGVDRRGEDEMRGAELFDAAQALNGRAVDQRHFLFVERDVAMDGVADGLHAERFASRFHGTARP